MLDTLSRLGLPVRKSDDEGESFISPSLSSSPTTQKSSDSEGGDLVGGDDGRRYIESARSPLVIGALDLRIPILAAALPELEVPPSRKVSSPFRRLPTNLVLNTLLSPQIFVVLLTFRFLNKRFKNN